MPPTATGVASTCARLARTVLAVQRAEGPERRALADEARAGLFQSAPAFTPFLPSALGDAHVRAARRICADRGYPLAFLFWAYPTWLLVAVIPIGVLVVGAGSPAAMELAGVLALALFTLFASRSILARL